MNVMILFGSESDVETGREAARILDKMDVSYELHVASAHRSPEKVKELVRKAEAEDAKAIIAGAGLSAHLAGVVAAETLLPVIGVPMAGGPLNGLDSLLSTVNMPGGVPVATVSLGKAGAKNAALLACRIVSLSDAAVKEKLDLYRQEMARAVDEADERVQKEI